jgi:hypothetical protein
MMASEDLHGFEVEDREIPRPIVPVGDEVRDRLRRSVAAMMLHATPEDLAGYLQDGFPARVTDELERPLVREELDAFVDLLLVVQQTPA